jgi:hypothetical protein
MGLILQRIEEIRQEQGRFLSFCRDQFQIMADSQMKFEKHVSQLLVEHVGFQINTVRPFVNQLYGVLAHVDNLRDDSNEFE